MNPAIHFDSEHGEDLATLMFSYPISHSIPSPVKEIIFLSSSPSLNACFTPRNLFPMLLFRIIHSRRVHDEAHFRT